MEIHPYIKFKKKISLSQKIAKKKKIHSPRKLKKSHTTENCKNWKFHAPPDNSKNINIFTTEKLQKARKLQKMEIISQKIDKNENSIPRNLQK